MKKSEETGVRVHIRITEKQHALLKRMSTVGGYTVSELLRRAIDRYVKDNWRKA